MSEFNLTESMSELTKSNNEKPVIKSREEAAAYFYNNETSDSSKPVILRGMNKMLMGYESLVVIENPSTVALDELIESCDKADKELDLVLVQSAALLEIVTLTDSFLLFKFSPEAGSEDLTPPSPSYFVIQLPVNGVGNTAFQKFCGIIKVPYSFARNNPGFLNRSIFEYKQKSMQMRREGNPMDVVYQKSTIEVRAELGGEVISYNAHPVINFLPLKANDTMDSVPVMARLPLISKILKNIRGEAESNNVNLKLQSYSLGYSGDNRGNHHARLIIGDSKFDVGGESYDLAVSVEANFMGGNGSDFGQVKIYYEAIRQVCVNGMVARWSENQRREAIGTYCRNNLSQRGIQEDTDRYTDSWMELESRMNAVLSSNGLSIPVASANAMIESSGFKQTLEVFMGVSGSIAENINKLDIQFGEIKDDYFVDVVEDAASHFKIPQHIVNFFLVEYLAGQMTENQPFNRPIDVMNFFTFVAKTYDSKIRMDVELKAYDFAAGLKSVLIDGTSYRDGTVNKYLRQIKTAAVSE